MFNEELALQLHAIEAIKFGKFTLKSGIESPIYIDLRLIISYPKILNAVAEAIHEKIQHLPYDILCGVPYTALPIATAMSLKHEKPMILRRKEARTYGTKKIIEGQYKSGQVCLVIEDLVTSGSSVMETIESLESEGLLVHDAVVLIDREQGGNENLYQRGCRLHSVFTITDMLHTLLKHGKIDLPKAEEIKNFIRSNQTVQTSTR